MLLSVVSDRYGTADWLSFENDLVPGDTARKTSALDARCRFAKVVVENLDESQAFSDVKDIAILSG